LNGFHVPLRRRSTRNRTFHAPHEVLARHQHAHGFAAFVLTGRYCEAGDTGCHRVGPGDVLVHAPFESHVDRFEARGAEVLVVPLADGWGGPVLGRIEDADAVVRVAERDPREAAALIAERITARSSVPGDWPDLLARALRSDPALSIAAWAAARGLHPGSVSRGFREVFGIAPARFRLVARAHTAVQSLRRTRVPLCDVAQDCGFADQAHMTRAVRALTALPPGQLRCLDTT
jgi:AraC-like DNA-binding protein